VKSGFFELNLESIFCSNWGIITLFFLRCTAEIYHYDDFLLEGHKLVYRFSGMYSPHNAPSNMAPGRGRSFISLISLKISQVPGQNDFALMDLEEEGYPNGPPLRNGTLDIAMFEKQHFDDLGVMIEIPGEEQKKHKVYCCTPEMEADRTCPKAGHLVLPKNSENYQVARLYVSPEGDTHALLQTENFEVKETGMYILLMANCDSFGQDYILNGHTVWMNPYGYLPGERWGDLPFFGIVSLCYLTLGLVWLVLCCCHCKDLLAIQMWTSVVLCLGMIETTTKYFDFLVWNEEGTRNLGAMVFGVVMGVSKRALSRVLVLLAALGYGVVKPNLGPTLRNVMLLGFIYLCLSMAYDLMNHLPTSDKEMESAPFVDSLAIIVLLTSFVDVLFYIWIFQALTQTLVYLHVRKQIIKCTLYIRFRFVLIVLVLFSISWSIYSIIMASGNRMEKQWKDAWDVNAVWEVLYLAILVAVCFLWRPTVNNQRYAYSHQLSTTEDGVEIGFMGGESDPDDDEYGGELPDDADDFLSVAAGVGEHDRQQMATKME